MIDFERPPASQPMHEDRLAAHKKLLMDTVAGGSPPRRRAARWVVPAVVTGLMLSGGVAVASFVTSKPASVVNEVRCYTEADTAGFYSSAVLATTHGALGDAAEDAVGNCAELWRIGLLSLGPADAQKPPVPHDPKQAAEPAEHIVPSLTACVLDEGVAAVFPGSAGTCERLGLPQLQQG